MMAQEHVVTCSDPLPLQASILPAAFGALASSQRQLALYPHVSKQYFSMHSNSTPATFHDCANVFSGEGRYYACLLRPPCTPVLLLLQDSCKRGDVDSRCRGLPIQDNVRVAFRADFGRGLMVLATIMLANHSLPLLCSVSA